MAQQHRHINDSLTAVHEGIFAGHVGPEHAELGVGEQGKNLVVKTHLPSSGGQCARGRCWTA